MKRFKSEAEMCDSFADAARAAGWTVYPETGGWDMLLVGTPETVGARGRGILRTASALPSPVMIGVQAKLHPNVSVLAQAIGRMSAFRLDRGMPDEDGPHVRAVLVPKATPGFRDVARLCRLHVFESRLREYPTRLEWDGLDHLYPGVLRESKRLPYLPPVVPDLPAGVPSPTTLGPWKVSAFALCRTLRARGYVTSADAKTASAVPGGCRLDIKSWVQRGWLVDTGEKDGRLTKYAVGPGEKLPDEQWPRLAEQCAEVA